MRMRLPNALLGGEPQFVDLGRANGRYFCTVAALGVDADVSSYVDAMQLPLRGTPAYVVGALRVLAQLSSLAGCASRVTSASSNKNYSWPPQPTLRCTEATCESFRTPTRLTGFSICA